MILRKPSYTIIEQGDGIEGIKKQIELAGRTCYHSGDKTTDTSADGFVERMVSSGHYAMLEHGTVYLMMDWDTTNINEKVASIKYQNNKYSHVNYVQSDTNKLTAYVTTNYRVLVENGWLEDLKYLSKPTEHHEKRITVKFETDRGVANEAVRHRVMSFAQESSRFCNYSKDRFNNEIKIAKPKWVSELNQIPSVDEVTYKGIFAEFLNYKNNRDEESKKHLYEVIYYWLMANEMAEFFYFKMLDCGMKPEDARAVLPLDLNTEIVITGFVKDWKHFFDLRADNTTGKAHPDMNLIAKPLKEEFQKRGLIK